MKGLFYAFFVLAGLAFAAGFAGGFLVDVHPESSSVSCGTPFEVDDGSFAERLPAHLEDDCRRAADRWMRFALIAYFGFFVPALILGLILQRRGEYPGQSPRTI